MWTAFSTFISNSLYTNVVNPIPTSFSYDINTHTVTQKHLPNSSDHQTATAIRLGQYHASRSLKFRKKIVANSFVVLPNQEKAYMLSDINGTETFKPVSSIDDYQTSDMVMYLKSKMKSFIKSRVEREEFRLKKCVDYIDSVNKNQKDFSTLAFSTSDPERSFNSIRSDIESQFALGNKFALVPSERTDSPFHLDGEAITPSGDSIPGQPRRLVYRGLLYISREPIEDGSDLAASFRRVFAVQTGVAVNQANLDNLT